MREQTTPQRENQTERSNLKPDSPISLHTLAQIVSAYCLLGWLTECFIGYNPDRACDHLKLSLSISL